MLSFHKLLLFTIIATILLIATTFATAASSGSSKKQSAPLRKSNRKEKFGEYHVNFVYDIAIPTFDNLTLHADGFFPDQDHPGQKFPLIIYPASWGCPGIEYIAKAFGFAEGGYATLEYAARGWWASGGKIDVAGPLDRKDISSVIDHAVNVLGDKWNINASAIGWSGISYGAGISLEAAGVDPRVKVVAAMSGWFNLTESIYPHETPALTSVDLLVGSSKLLGHPSQILLDMAYDIQNYKNIPQVTAFGNDRSPAMYMDIFNQRQIPIFYSCNFEDSIFPPDVSLKYFEQLKTPKMFLLNQGGHAEAEAFGLFDVPHNYVWVRAKKWFDYWLYDKKDNGIMDEPQLQFESGNTLFSGNYVPFTSWPPANGTQQKKAFYSIKPRGNDQFGGLYSSSGLSFQQQQKQQQRSEATTNNKKPPHLFHHLQQQQPKSNTNNRRPHHRNNNNVGGADDYIGFSTLPGFGTGGFFSGYLGPIGIPHDNELALSDRDTSLVYRTEPFSADWTLCGTPRLNITVTPNDDKWQIIPYLFEVDIADIGRLVTYSQFSSRQPGSTGRPFRIQELVMRPVCTVMKAGHRLAIGFTLYDQLFATASNSSQLSVDFSSIGASLEIPYTP